MFSCFFQSSKAELKPSHLLQSDGERGVRSVGDAAQVIDEVCVRALSLLLN